MDILTEYQKYKAQVLKIMETSRNRSGPVSYDYFEKWTSDLLKNIEVLIQTCTPQKEEPAMFEIQNGQWQ